MQMNIKKERPSYADGKANHSGGVARKSKYRCMYGSESQCASGLMSFTARSSFMIMALIAIISASFANAQEIPAEKYDGMDLEGIGYRE